MDGTFDPRPVTSRPSLLFYTHGLVDGGAERLWACLATEFHRRGHRVVFAQDFSATENLANLDPDIPVHTLGRNHWSCVTRLTQLLRDEKPAIALSAVGGSNLKLIAARRRAGIGTRVIATYHGFNEWRTGVLSLLTYAGLPWLSRDADRVVGVSDGLRNALLRRWRSRADKTVAIHNPVFFPAATPVPTATELAARDKVVLAVGRMVREKDFSTLVRAFALVRDKDARLVILGKGPLQGALEREIAALGLTDRVSLPGYAAEPWLHYARARCFVTSSVSEPFGNVVVEALAHGLPIVATACDGPIEILDNGRFGRIVAVRDPHHMAAAIDAELADPGDPAPRRARADAFSFAERVPAYEALIAQVLSDADATRPDAGRPTALAP